MRRSNVFTTPSLLSWGMKRLSDEASAEGGIIIGRYVSFFRVDEHLPFCFSVLAIFTGFFSEIRGISVFPFSQPIYNNNYVAPTLLNRIYVS